MAEKPAAKPKQVRWQCPENLHPGVLGPSRPRMDNICRYCLDCSKAQGKLVHRVSPVLERKRAAGVEKNKAKSQAKVARGKAKDEARYFVKGGIDLRKVWKLAWSMDSLGGKRYEIPKMELRRTKVELHTKASTGEIINFTSSKYVGRAHVWQGRVTMTITGGADVASAESSIGLILHELAHMACYMRGEPYGDSEYRFGRRVEEAIEEWNRRHGGRYVKVNAREWGAYRGSIGRSNRRVLKGQAAKRKASN